MIAVLALSIAAPALISIIFTPAIFYDLFWPERWEAPIVQKAWKWSASLSSVVQLAAAIAATAIVATGSVSIQASSADFEA